jgi:hypothetical protein
MTAVPHITTIDIARWRHHTKPQPVRNTTLCDVQHIDVGDTWDCPNCGHRSDVVDDSSLTCQECLTDWARQEGQSYAPRAYILFEPTDKFCSEYVWLCPTCSSWEGPVQDHSDDACLPKMLTCGTCQCRWGWEEDGFKATVGVYALKRSRLEIVLEAHAG